MDLGCRLEQHRIEAVAPIGEDLTIDVALWGNPLAQKMFIISSGLHGVEGFFGAAVQLALLTEHLPRYQLPEEVGMIFLHALNPFGFAWLRRTNEDNVDLNRNFLLADEVFSGSPPTYARLDPFLNPPSPPSPWEPFLLKSLGLIARYGMSALKQTLPVGQYDFPQGLFFGGTAPSQTQQILTAHLPRWIGLARQVIHIDLHTGLGKWGTYQLFAEIAADHPRCQLLRQQFGREYLLTLDPQDLVYRPRGSFGNWCQTKFPDLTYDFLLAEFGTDSMLRVLKNLRAENRAHWWGEPEDRSYQWAKQQLLAAFIPHSPRWRDRALKQGVDLCLRIPEIR
jgi:hypothetical protein